MRFVLINYYCFCVNKYVFLFWVLTILENYVNLKVTTKRSHQRWFIKYSKGENAMNIKNIVCGIDGQYGIFNVSTCSTGRGFNCFYCLSG